MHLDFGFVGRGIVMQHITPEDAVQQRARFVMFAKTTAAFAKFYLLSEANHVRYYFFLTTYFNPYQFLSLKEMYIFGQIRDMLKIRYIVKMMAQFQSIVDGFHNFTLTIVQNLIKMEP